MDHERTIDHGSATQNVQCLTGQVVLIPTTGIGATNAVLWTHGTTIRLRQVPGPNNRGIPLAQADGQTVSVCGNFLFDGGQVIFNVQAVFPLLQSQG